MSEACAVEAKADKVCAYDCIYQRIIGDWFIKKSGRVI
jgi:hypothetical protein